MIAGPPRRHERAANVDDVTGSVVRGRPRRGTGAPGHPRSTTGCAAPHRARPAERRDGGRRRSRRAGPTRPSRDPNSDGDRSRLAVRVAMSAREGRPLGSAGARLAHPANARPLPRRGSCAAPVAAASRVACGQATAAISASVVIRCWNTIAMTVRASSAELAQLAESHHRPGNGGARRPHRTVDVAVSQRAGPMDDDARRRIERPLPRL